MFGSHLGKSWGFNLLSSLATVNVRAAIQNVYSTLPVLHIAWVSSHTGSGTSFIFQLQEVAELRWAAREKKRNSTRKLKTCFCLSLGTGSHARGNTEQRAGSCLIRNASMRWGRKSPLQSLHSPFLGWERWVSLIMPLKCVLALAFKTPRRFFSPAGKRAPYDTVPLQTKPAYSSPERKYFLNLL